MTQNELIINHLSETRKRSILLWMSLPENFYDWKPDPEAMTAIQMIRHVLQADYGWNMIINKEDMSGYHTPWEDHPYSNVENEIEFAEPYRQIFLQSIRNFSEKELSNTIIIHPGNGAEKLLGSYLLRGRIP